MTNDVTSFKLQVHKALTSGISFDVKPGGKGREFKETELASLPVEPTDEFVNNVSTVSNVYKHKALSRKDDKKSVQYKDTYSKQEEEASDDLLTTYETPASKTTIKKTPGHVKTDKIFSEKPEPKERRIVTKEFPPFNEVTPQTLDFWHRNRHYLANLIKVEYSQYNLKCDPYYSRHALRGADHTIRELNPFKNAKRDFTRQNAVQKGKLSNQLHNPELFDIFSFAKAADMLTVFDDELQESLKPSLEIVA